MKKLHLAIVFTAIVYVLFGCSAPIQLVADLAGNRVASAIKSDSNKSNSPKIDLLDRIYINDLTINVTRRENGSASFGAYNRQGKIVGVFFLNYDNKVEMEKFQQYTSMNEQDKKKFLRENFLARAKLDLGPIESETTETLPSAPSFPTPSFAPTPSKPR